MKKRSILALLLAASITAGALTACSGMESTTPTPEQATATPTPEQAAVTPNPEQTVTIPAPETPTQGGTFVFPLNQDISSFNAIGSDVIPFRAIFDPLYIADQGDVRYYLAESYSVSDDGLEVTIKLKDNLKWHDRRRCDLFLPGRQHELEDAEWAAGGI